MTAARIQCSSIRAALSALHPAPAHLLGLEELESLVASPAVFCHQVCYTAANISRKTPVTIEED